MNRPTFYLSVAAVFVLAASLFPTTVASSVGRTLPRRGVTVLDARTKAPAAPRSPTVAPSSALKVIPYPEGAVPPDC